MTAQEEYERNLDRFQRYLEKRGYGGTTLDMYPRAVRMLWAFFERAGRFPSPVEITVGDLREFAVYLLSKHTGSSPTGYIVGLRRFFGFLEAEGVITRSPARNVFPPKAHPRPANPLQRRELSALLRACSGSGFADLRDMALFRIFMATGARRSEVVGLRVDPDDNGRGALDLAGGVVELRDRYGRTRRCALDPHTVRTLARYLVVRAAHHNSGLSNLWITKHGGLTTGGIHEIVTARATSAWVKGFHLHRLRITFAHHWLRAGGQPGDLMRILGLRSRKMIDGYADGVAGSRSIEVARARFADGP